MSIQQFGHWLRLFGLTAIVGGVMRRVRNSKDGAIRAVRFPRDAFAGSGPAFLLGDRLPAFRANTGSPRVDAQRYFTTGDAAIGAGNNSLQNMKSCPTQPNGARMATGLQGRN